MHVGNLNLNTPYRIGNQLLRKEWIVGKCRDHCMQLTEYKFPPCSRGKEKFVSLGE